MLSTIVLLALSFATLGLLLGLAASYDTPITNHQLLPSNIQDRDQAMQQKLFEECIIQARLDGTLTDDEYNKCAYNIYD